MIGFLLPNRLNSILKIPQWSLAERANVLAKRATTEAIVMRAHGQIKLGFHPLPPAEANRLKNWLNFQERFSALDPRAGDGVAFAHLVRGGPALRYGIEIDAYRAEEARALEIETQQANAIEVRCQAETVSLLYLNPPYDWEAGSSNNQRLESVFLEHSYRWLKPGGGGRHQDLARPGAVLS